MKKRMKKKKNTEVARKNHGHGEIGWFPIVSSDFIGKGEHNGTASFATGDFPARAQPPEPNHSRGAEGCNATRTMSDSELDPIMTSKSDLLTVSSPFFRSNQDDAPVTAFVPLV